MSAIEDYERAISSEATVILKAALPGQWDAIDDRLRLLLNGGAEPLDQKYARNREDFIRRLFLEFTEITESLDRLRDIAVYVRRFPYSDTSISKSAHLRYHVENYLNEVYILRNRLEAYLKVVVRLYKQDARSSRVKTITATLQDTMPRTFAVPTAVRGKHVHRQRYSDADLERLRLLELLKDDSNHWASAYESTYLDVRRLKRAWIERMNRQIDKLLELYFAYLKQLLFDPQGALILPQDLVPSA